MTAASPPTAGADDARARFATVGRSHYPVVMAAFVGVLLISNIAATKLIAFGPLITDGGALLFPLVYIIGDVLAEVYGLRATRRAIFVGFVLAALASVTFLLVGLAPPADGYENQEAFVAVLGFVPRIVAASLAGYLVGQLLNALVMVKLKQREQERRLWVRLIGSTMVGELADTIVFCTIAFFGVITGTEFLIYVAVGYVWKVAVEIVLLPVTYAVIDMVKRNEPSYSAETADVTG